MDTVMVNIVQYLNDFDYLLIVVVVDVDYLNVNYQHQNLMLDYNDDIEVIEFHVQYLVYVLILHQVIVVIVVVDVVVDVAVDVAAVVGVEVIDQFLMSDHLVGMLLLNLNSIVVVVYLNNRLQHQHDHLTFPNEIPV